jgi:Flp pilus assembly protein TadG
MIRTLAKLWRDENGAVAPFIVMLLIPIIGMVALGGEVSGWYMKQRQLQNAADSAALAAAANGSTTTVNGVPSYQREAYGVAGTYGFKSSGDTVVTPSTVTCPSGSGTCFQVAISTKVPLYLAQIIGYKGNATLSSDSTRMATTVAAFAIASSKVAYNYCLTGLGTTNPPVNGAQANVDLRGGGPNSDYSKCAAQSKGSVNCTANNFPYIQAPDQHGNTCGSAYHTVGASSVIDPYASFDYTTLIANKLAGSSCYTGALTGTITASVVKICSSNNTMTGPITVQAPAGSTDPPVIVIYDTTLHTAGFSVSTTSGVGALGGTVIVTGAGTSNLNQWFDGNGNVYIQGSNGGSFDDLSILVDPKLNPTQPFDPGNNSHVNLHALGTIYAPHTDILVGGSMDAQIGAYKCVSIIAQSIYSNGGSLANNPLDCAALGFNLAETLVTRQTLVG